MSTFLHRVDYRRATRYFLRSRSSLISPSSTSSFSPIAFKCIATSDSSVLTARTALQVYRSWISTVSAAISSGRNPALHISIVILHRPPPGTRGTPPSPDWHSRWSNTPDWPIVSVPCPNRRQKASNLAWYAMFSRSGSLTKYILAPPVRDRNRSEALSSSLHCPNVAYSSN